VNPWLKKAAIVMVLLGFLSVMLPLAWAMLRPALPVLFLTVCALYILVRIFKPPGGR
jgi:uncharacterized membrane protein